MNNKLILNECPRDAMQGLDHFVPTDLKVMYLNALMKAGFSRLDFGSFVSPKAIPQMRDTAEVIARLEYCEQTKLLAIVANLRGAKDALQFQQIDFLGFPLSISEQFQFRNTNKSISDALAEIAEIQNLCLSKGKKLVVYLSMAFGNPYGEKYSSELVLNYGNQLQRMEISHISLADTVGLASPDEVFALFKSVLDSLNPEELTAHLHANPENAQAKIEAAWKAGCRNFDTALGGFGGCPMAEDKLVGNLSTESILSWAEENSISHQVKLDEMQIAQSMLGKIFMI